MEIELQKIVKLITSAVLMAFLLLPFTGTRVEAVTYDYVRATDGYDVSNFVDSKILSSAASAIEFANPKSIDPVDSKKYLVLVYACNADANPKTYDYIIKEKENKKWGDIGKPVPNQIR